MEPISPDPRNLQRFSAYSAIDGGRMRMPDGGLAIQPSEGSPLVPAGPGAFEDDRMPGRHSMLVGGAMAADGNIYPADQFITRNPYYRPDIDKAYQDHLASGGFEKEYARYPSEDSNILSRQYDNPGVLSNRLKSPEEHKEDVRLAFLLERLGSDDEAEALRNPYSRESKLARGMPLRNLLEYAGSGPSAGYNFAMHMGNQVARALGPKGMQDPYPDAGKNALANLNTFTMQAGEGRYLPESTPDMWERNYRDNAERNALLDENARLGFYAYKQPDAHERSLQKTKEYHEKSIGRRDYDETMDGYGYMKKMLDEIDDKDYIPDSVKEPLSRLYGVVGDTLMDPFAATKASSFVFAPARAAAQAGTNKGLRYILNFLKEAGPDFIPEAGQYAVEKFSEGGQ